MARYTGPRTKKSRRFGAALFGPHKALERRNYPPGVHGIKGRKKQSDYAVALGEKQKLRYTYGILERQFRRYFEIASRKRGVTGDILLQLLETRLDNVVFRLGLASSRRAARQFVLHRHILVNGRVVNIPSFQVKTGDVIEVRDRPKSRAYAARSLEAMQLSPVPDWLVIDKEQFRGEVKRLPTREEIAPVANEQLVVELYSR
ncbi:MAG: 30S ribosomal protein S4 [Methylacidiphilales bacterium]|nr:30S ribosomal protein S4 [Candidatus Methylacidiphilales bacterium]MDW8348963.1 30S ribosomal protein S4 [Verrucomicrobiae bacterium]